MHMLGLSFKEAAAWLRGGNVEYRAPDPVEVAAKKGKRQREAEAHAGTQLQKASRLWGRGKPADGTVVETYLASRGIRFQPLPATLRYLPPNPPQYPYPKMLAAFGLAAEPIPGLVVMTTRGFQGLHVTELLPDGSGKAPETPDKWMLAQSFGTPIVLRPVNDNGGLLVAEGLETALSCGHIGIGLWAAGTANRLPGLADKVPDYAEAVTVAVDSDAAGRKYSTELADRLYARGFEVSLMEAR
jgi:hypothetical protein